MEFQSLLKKIEDPDKLINPQEIVDIRMALGFYIDELESSLFQYKLDEANKLNELRKGTASDTMAKNQLMLSEEHQKVEETTRLKKRLSRFRSDLKDRLDVLLQRKYR